MLYRQYLASELGSLLAHDMQQQGNLVSYGLQIVGQPRELESLTASSAVQENAPSVRSHSGTLVLGLRTPQAPPPLFMSQVCACHLVLLLYLLSSCSCYKPNKPDHTFVRRIHRHPQ